MTYNAQIWQGHTMDIAGTYTHTQSYLMRFNALRILKYPGIIGYDIVVLNLTLFLFKICVNAIFKALWFFLS